MRPLIVAFFLVLVTACGGNESATAEPTATPDKRVEHWAEVLAQRQFEYSPGVCMVIDQPTGSFGLSDDASIINQIPIEIGEAVSVRMMEKLQEKCDQSPTTPPDCGWTCYIEPSPSN